MARGYRYAVRRSRKRRLTRESAYSRAKRYARNVAVYGGGAAAAGLGAMALYRNYPALTSYFKSLGYYGLGLANKVYDYVRDKGLAGGTRARDAVYSAKERARARWEAYQAEGNRTRWQDIHDARYVGYGPVIPDYHTVDGVRQPFVRQTSWNPFVEGEDDSTMASPRMSYSISPRNLRSGRRF